jgi:hypothetical protein
VEIVYLHSVEVLQALPLPIEDGIVYLVPAPTPERAPPAQPDLCGTSASGSPRPSTHPRFLTTFWPGPHAGSTGLARTLPEPLSPPQVSDFSSTPKGPRFILASWHTAAASLHDLLLFLTQPRDRLIGDPGPRSIPGQPTLASVRVRLDYPHICSGPVRPGPGPDRADYARILLGQARRAHGSRAPADLTRPTRPGPDSNKPGSLTAAGLRPGPTRPGA